MAIKTVHGDARSCSDINMTPLIDVMLVLLIIFIITIPPVTHAVKIDSPQPAVDPPPLPPDVIDLAIDFDGTLIWGGAAVDRTALQERIRAAAAKSPQPEVHIAVDRFARYEIVAQTLADLQHRGLQKVGFVGGETGLSF